MANHVYELGKLCYVEPNDFVEEKQYTTSKKDGSYNITHPYEDYSISVDLTVTIPNRLGQATNSHGSHTFSLLNKGLDGSSISFFSGTEGLMTDSPGITTYHDIMKGSGIEGAEESLGITNIHITYNSYFYPEVTINFTDIRGSALMMPHEENYRRQQINLDSGESVYNTSVENFFSALFAFPYPEFKLSVKGFYGKKVEYSLLVKDFKSSFNSQTGNFDATVQFIGRMYGIYTDIPMIYLLIAPYCKYGSDSVGKAMWESHGFTFDNGSPMPTFIKLREKIKLAQNQMESWTLTEANAYATYNQTKTKLEELQEIQTKYRTFSSHIRSTSNYDSFYDAANYTFLFNCSVTKSNGANPQVNGVQCSYSWDSQTEAKFNDLYTAISNYNTTYETNIPFFYKIPNGNTKIKDTWANTLLSVINNGEGDIRFTSVHFGNDIANSVWSSIAYSIYQSSGDLRLDRISNVAPVIYDYMKTSCTTTPNTELGFLVLSGGTMMNRIETEILNLKTELLNLEKQVNTEYNTKLEKVLGFRPSIKNIYKILMAHLQCFMEIYASFINNVTGVNARTLESLNLTYDTTDIPNNGLSVNEVMVPPFPAVKNRLNNTFVYPLGTTTYPMEECKLVDALFDGTYNFLSGLTLSDATIDMLQEGGVELIPTCLTDYITRVNPYTNVFKRNEGTTDIDWIYTFFGLRCISYFLLEQSGRLDDKTFGRYEAYNFWKVNKNLSPQTINIIKTNDFNAGNFVQFLLGKIGTPCYQKDSTTSALLTTRKEGKSSSELSLIRTEERDNLMLTGKFNFPAVVGRSNGSDNSIDTFWSDITNVNYTFKNGDSKNFRPLQYIQMIENSVLEEWKESFDNDTGITQYVSDDNKKIFAESYLTNPGDVFRDGFITYRDAGLNISQFYNRYSEETGTSGAIGKKTINEFHKEQCPDTFLLNNITDCELNVPVFFTNKMSNAEAFLINIPHNTERIGKAMRDGKALITIPYATELFLGCVIYHWLNDTEENFKIFAEKIRKRDEACARTLGENNGSFRGVGQNLHLIIAYLVRKDNGEFHEIIEDDGELSDIDELISFFKNYSSTYTNDYLGLSEKYLTWSTSERQGGFKYFSNHYQFISKTDSDGWHRSGTLQSNGQYNFSVDCRGTCGTELRYIGNKYTDVPGGCFNRLYRIICASNNTTSCFTDRFSAFEYFKDSQLCSVCLRTDYVAYQPLADFFKKSSRLVVPYQMHAYDENEYAYASVQGNSSAGAITLGSGQRYIQYKGETKPHITPTKFTNAFNEFKALLTELFNSANGGEGYVDYSNFNSEDITYDSKLSMYLTLKNLYDKHLSDLPSSIDKYDITKNDSEFKRFHFIDTFYNDLGDTLMINSEILEEVLNALIGGEDATRNETIVKNEMSVYSFMSLLTQKNNMMLLAMPIFNGSFSKEDGAENLEQMFKPLSYNEAVNGNVLRGPSYVCFYPHQASQHLDLPTSQYSDDGFNLIEDLNGTGSFTTPTCISDLASEGDYVIPAFGVEYGSMKQSIFKSVNVNMDSPQTTEIAVANQFALAQGRSTDVRKLGFEGQDLYKIYSNYSFTCQVEMMGCAQIQPLMYFQLNNIPMFRGAYQIIQVEHDITPGTMTTSFKGVRINRTKIPMVRDEVAVTIPESPQDELPEVPDSSQDEQPEVPDSSQDELPEVPEIPVTPSVTPSGNNRVTTNNRDFELFGDYNVDGMANVSTLSPSAVTYDFIDSEAGMYLGWDSASHNSSNKIGFNDTNEILRNMAYSILLKLKERGLKMYINGTSRCRKFCAERSKSVSSGSDHLYEKAEGSYSGPDARVVFTPNRYRTEHNGYDAYGKSRELQNLGCAIDFQGGIDSNGMKQRSTVGIQIFQLLASEYKNCIRQLIWELAIPKKKVSKGTVTVTDTSADTVGTCVHVSSYGSGVTTPQIFVAYNSAGKSIPFEEDSNGKPNLPPTFMRIIRDMAINNKLDGVTLNNWTAHGLTKPTKEELITWCRNLGIPDY